jgi:hypothetical protein
MGEGYQGQTEVDLSDGWAHPGDDLESLQREMKGFIEGDKHEQVMNQFAKQMRDDAEAQKQKLNGRGKKRLQKG